MRTVTTSPHFHSGASTQKIMLNVAIALTPSWLWGVYVFGINALYVMLVSMASAVLTEYLLGKISHEYTINDFSALVTGMMVGMNMPAEIPLFIPVLCSFFAIAICKWTFGGLGCNWANPAIAGRVFVFFSFSSAMSKFSNPKTLVFPSAISSASPLSFTKTIISSKEALGLTSVEILANEGYPVSEFAAKLSKSTGFNAYNIDAFLGNIPGCIGEVSKILLLIGIVYLFITKIITVYIPVSYVLSFSLFTWVFAGIPNGLGLFHGEVVASLLRGSLIIAAFFMANDMVTSPIARTGQIIYGIGCGFLTFLFRSFGSIPESCSVAILMMNIVTPTINKYYVPKKFGEIPEKGLKKEIAK